MTRSEKDEMSSRLFDMLLDDIILETVQEAQYNAARTKSQCSKCKTTCRIGIGPFGLRNIELDAVLYPGTVPLVTPNPNGSASRGDSSPGTPLAGTSTPKSGESNDYVIECTNCSRSLAASRFASHLSACMGLANGSRRARTNSKPILTELPSGSESEAEIALESTLGKAKAKPKTKQTDDAEFDLKRKRPSTPQASPPKPKARRGRPPGSTNAKKKGEQEANGAAKMGSKKVLAAQARRSSTPGSSRFSSPGLGLSASKLGFSSNTSPALQNREPDLSGQSSLGSVAMMTHQPSPPRPAAVHDFDLGLDGDETGSSTDTDSS